MKTTINLSILTLIEAFGKKKEKIKVTFLLKAIYSLHVSHLHFVHIVGDYPNELSS